MGETVGVVIDGKTIGTLKALRDRLADDPLYGAGHLPRWMPDGSPVTSVKQVGGLLGSDDWTAALAVLQADAAPVSLTLEAKDVYSGMAPQHVDPGLHDGRRKRKRSHLRRRPKRQRIIQRAGTLQNTTRRKKKKRGDTP